MCPPPKPSLMTMKTSCMSSLLCARQPRSRPRGNKNGIGTGVLPCAVWCTAMVGNKWQLCQSPGNCFHSDSPHNRHSTPVGADLRRSPLTPHRFVVTSPSADGTLKPSNQRRRAYDGPYWRAEWWARMPVSKRRSALRHTDEGDRFDDFAIRQEWWTGDALPEA